MLEQGSRCEGGFTQLWPLKANILNISAERAVLYSSEESLPSFFVGRSQGDGSVPRRFWSMLK